MKDKVFDKHLAPGTAFEFNQEVADVFDDMVSRSVPFYDEIHRLFEWMMLSAHQRQDPPREIDTATMRHGDQFFWWLEVGEIQVGYCSDHRMYHSIPISSSTRIRLRKCRRPTLHYRKVDHECDCRASILCGDRWPLRLEKYSACRDR